MIAPAKKIYEEIDHAAFIRHEYAGMAFENYNLPFIWIYGHSRPKEHIGIASLSPRKQAPRGGKASDWEFMQPRGSLCLQEFFVILKMPFDKAHEADSLGTRTLP